MRGMLSVFPVKCLWSGCWTTQLGPHFDDSLIDLTAISTHGITTLSVAIWIAPCIRLSTVITVISTAFWNFSSILFSKNWFWHTLFSPTLILPKLLERLLVWVFEASSPIALALVFLPMKKEKIIWSLNQVIKLPFVLVVLLSCANHSM